MHPRLYTNSIKFIELFFSVYNPPSSQKYETNLAIPVTNMKISASHLTYRFYLSAFILAVINEYYTILLLIHSIRIVLQSNTDLIHGYYSCSITRIILKKGGSKTCRKEKLSLSLSLSFTAFIFLPIQSKQGTTLPRLSASMFGLFIQQKGRNNEALTATSDSEFLYKLSETTNQLLIRSPFFLSEMKFN